MCGYWGLCAQIIIRTEPGTAIRIGLWQPKIETATSKLTYSRINNVGLFSSVTAWGGSCARKYDVCEVIDDIVTKASQALILAHEDSHYTNILQSTRVIVFFGTPHLGLKQADFLSMLVGIVNGVPIISARQDLVQLLRPGSKELQNLSMSFTHRTEGIDIISFSEEKAMSPFKHPVSRFPFGQPQLFEELMRHFSLYHVNLP